KELFEQDTLLWSNHDRLPLLHDSGFFKCYLGKSPAEIFAVIKADRGYYRKKALYDIGRIRPPPHPRFDDRQIDPLFGKTEKSDCGHELEECGLFGSSPEHSLRSFIQKVFGYFDIVYSESLGKTGQMRRGEKSRPVTGTRHDRREESPGRPFAVSSGYLHRFQISLWIAEP